MHKWLRELAGELEERIAVDRDDNERLPRLLTVHIDAQVGGGPGSGGASPVKLRPDSTSAAAAAAAEDYGPDRNRVQPSGNWRAGLQASSRSVALHKPVAEAMALDALQLVKKWAVDR